MRRESEQRTTLDPYTPLRVDVVTDGQAFAALRGEWGALLESSGASLFNSWEWLYPWWRRLGADRALRILTARASDGRLVGLMPLSLQTVRVLGRDVRRVCFLGESHVGSDYLDVVALRGFEQATALQFAAELRAVHGCWDVLDLLDVLEGSITLQVLRQVFAADHELVETPRHLCPHEPLQAEPFDAFLRRTGRRDNFLRRKKWLEKQPGYQVERISDPSKLAASMAEFFRLHGLRWAEDGGSQGITNRDTESFHRDATQLLAEKGCLRMYTMRVGEAAVASVYGMIHQGRFLYYQSGYDPAWRPRSVGLVLVGETFKDALEGGMVEYDFLRGTEGYKADWTTQRKQTVALRIFRRGSPGHALQRSEERARDARGLVKRALPETTVEKFRRLRRRLTSK